MGCGRRPTQRRVICEDDLVLPREHYLQYSPMPARHAATGWPQQVPHPCCHLANLQGDSGGPLLLKSPAGPAGDLAVGAVSWGIGCAEQTPGVYADVASASQWIKNTIQVGGGASLLWLTCHIA